ncbi:cupin domain-containing protein [Nocardia sp. NPDC051463]|uniref:cupin domain-containing protein n=1 Tax=Nocardia sp. NPDC051463 TaxID=3154845 RepID=UPI00341E1293
MRRIVIGHNDSGKTQVLSDANIDPITIALLPGAKVHRMWELDDLPTLPVTNVQAAANGTYFPGPGGLRFGLISIPPGLSYAPPSDVSAEAMAAAVAEADAKLPGMLATFDEAQEGIHTTQTVDFVIVLSGEGRLRTDDGVDLPLRPGDCLIQNGSAHGWFNDGPEPFVFCYTLCGADSGSGD